MSFYARNLDADARDPGGAIRSASPQAVKSVLGPRLEKGLRLLPLYCAVAILWLATRHYFGVVQDARFYAVEALRATYPARYAGDLYFQFGSQGSFSLFTTFYRPVVALLGVGAAGMAVAVAGQLLWLFGLFRLARCLTGQRFLWLSLAVVIAMPNLYAPYFGYGEAFATPRLFAEALSLLALSLLRTRPAWTFVLLGAAAALHPLMALPGLAAAFVYLALGRPFYWGLVPAAVALAAVLGWADIQPFANLHRTLDADWYSVVSIRSLQVLLTRWPSDAWFQVLNGLGWGAIGLFAVPSRDRRFLAAVLAAGVGGLALTLIGADFAHNVLVVELQPWRAMWLLLVVVRIFIPVILFSLLAKRIANPFAFAALLSITLILVSSATRLVRLPTSEDFGFLDLALVTLALAAIYTRLVEIAPKFRYLGQALSCLAIIATPVAAWGWDTRTPWTKFVEAPLPPPPALTKLLPEGASVYWEDSTVMLWFRLKRASYFSCDQGTGVAFHRETAMTYRRRADSFWPLRTADFTQSKVCTSLDKQPKPERTRQGLQELCRKEPGLDDIVLLAPIPGVAPKLWQPPLRFEDIQASDGVYASRSTDRFYIYSCAGMR